MEKVRDLFFMNQALQLAKEAEKQGEVPVGAVLVQESPGGPKIVAREKPWISIADISKTPAVRVQGIPSRTSRGFADATNNKGFSQPTKINSEPIAEAVPPGVDLKQQIIAQAFNQKESLKKATAHAEILAIEKASRKLGRWRLNDCVLYVTLEPCPMCAGALIACRLKKLVYACQDPKAGAVHSLYQISQDPRLNHRVQVHSGVLQKESSQLLKAFFQKRRKKAY